MIKNKFYIISISLFLVSVSGYAIYSDIGTLYEKVKNITAVQNRLSQISSYQKIIKELQRERGLACIYKSNTSQDIYKKLIQQEKTLHDMILQQSKNIDITKIIQNVDILEKQLLQRTVSQSKIFQLYTKNILDLLRENKKLLLYANNAEIKNKLLEYQKLGFIQEYFGELRAEIGAIIGDKKKYKEFLPLVQKTNILLQNAKEDLYSYSQSSAQEFHSLLYKSPAVVQVQDTVAAILSGNIDRVKLKPLQWYQVATMSVDLLYQYATKNLTTIKKDTDKKSAGLQERLDEHIAFWIVSVLIGLGILFAIYKTNREINKKNRLLNDYKKAIDASTIVSKTDKQGRIIYANQAFCDISGYTQEELLGKPHNIVRHQDMPKEAFKELWDTLKRGAAWRGEVKNRKKDGDYYWVQATISPIYDNENNLVEYIAIREDITEIVKLSEEIQSTQKELIYRIGESVESRSKETGNHIRRVAKYSELLGELYGMDASTCETLSIASTMHDVGKIAIPDAILLKPSKLDREEFEIMKSHAHIGYKILSGSKLPILQMAAEIAYGHHERYNGGGYPRNIAGEEISIYARIVAVADVFDALISDRVYKKAWKFERVVELFTEEKGKQFDPKLVTLLLDNIDLFIDIKQKYED